MEDGHYLALTGPDARPAAFFDARKLFRKRSTSVSTAMQADETESGAPPRASLGSHRRPSIVSQQSIGESTDAPPPRRRSRPRTSSGIRQSEPVPALPTASRKSARPLSAPIDKVSNGPFLSLLSHEDEEDFAEGQDSHSRRPSFQSVRPTSGDLPRKFVQKRRGEAKPMVAGPESFVYMNGRRHHPFSRFVPYPRSYETSAVDSDVWGSLLMAKMARGPTCHRFEQPPEKVLDVGCGTGSWIMQSAAIWTNTQFVGVDVVPLQPPLSDPVTSDVAARITWIKANILEGLPFPSNEFDMVRISRLACGVDEKQWNNLFEDIARVLKPGGAFEMIDEDIFFPGKHVDAPDFMPESSLISAPTPTPSLTSFDRLRSDIEAQFEDAPLDPYMIMLPSIAFPSFQAVTVTSPGAKDTDSVKPRPSTVHATNAPPVNPRNHAVLEAIWAGMHADRFINLYPLPLLASFIQIYFEDMRTHAPITYFFPSCQPPSSECEATEDKVTQAPPNVKSLEDWTPNPPGSASASVFSGNRMGEQLPNGPLDLCPGNERLHLRLRVAEVLACTETMWESVLKFQEAGLPQDATAVQRAVVDMRRRDFDRLLSYFQYDMGDRIAMNDSLHGWGQVSTVITDDRKAYDAAARAWDEYMASLPPRQERGHSSTVAVQDPWGPEGAGRMSRTIRVFCAWKADEQPTE